MTAEHVWIASAGVALPAFVGAFLLAFSHAARASRAAGVVGSLGAVALFASFLADGATCVALAW